MHNYLAQKINAQHPPQWLVKIKMPKCCDPSASWHFLCELMDTSNKSTSFKCFVPKWKPLTPKLIGISQNVCPFLDRSVYFRKNGSSLNKKWNIRWCFWWKCCHRLTWKGTKRDISVNRILFRFVTIDSYFTIYSNGREKSHGIVYVYWSHHPAFLCCRNSIFLCLFCVSLHVICA